MPSNFTAMTWNVENLFPVGSKFGPTDDAIYQQKIANLASAIRLIAPDVVAVQEIGAQQTFDDLHEALKPDYPRARLAAHPDPRGIRVGFLSRHPLHPVDELVKFPAGGLPAVPDGQGGTIAQLARGAPTVEVHLPSGIVIRMTTAHLKSKLITYPGERFTPQDEDERARFTGVALLQRTAEAVALRVHTNALTKGNARPLILLGDLNDGPEAVTTQLLLGPEDGSLAAPDKGDDVRLYNLASYLPEGRRYSRVFKKQRELIDHILVSHELIFKQREVNSYVELIESVGVNPRGRRDAVLPDHAPVYARFELP